MSDSFVDDGLKPTEITDMWDNLGLTENEKQSAIKALNEEIEKLQKEFLDQQIAKRDAIKENIVKRRNTLKQVVKALPDSKEAIEEISKLGQNGTLKERIQELDIATQKYFAEYEQASSKFKEVKEELDEIFDRLGYDEEERGEFNEIGYEDLSDERLKRFEKEKKKLQNEVEHRLEALGRNGEQIKEILDELGDSMTTPIQTITQKSIITNSAFSMMEKYFDDLQAIKHARQTKMSEMAIKISNLWELLETPEEERQKFVANHAQLSSAVLQDCYDEIQRLQKMKLDHLPELIEKQKIQIEEGCKVMHRTPDECEQIIRNALRPKDCHRQFANLDEAVLKLQREIILATPALRMIEQREEIIRDYKEIQHKEKDGDGKQPKEVDIQQSIRVDKAKRRFKFVLPRLEKKLLISLLEYQHATGRELTYDGTPYARQLGQIPLSDDEIKKARIGGRRQSLAVRKKSLEGMPEPRTRRRSEWPVAAMD